MIQVQFKVTERDLGRVVRALGDLKVYDFSQRAVDVEPAVDGKVIPTAKLPDLPRATRPLTDNSEAAAEVDSAGRTTRHASIRGRRQLATLLRETNSETLTTAKIRELLPTIGLHEPSYSHYIAKLLAAKVLKQTRRGVYRVIR